MRGTALVIGLCCVVGGCTCLQPVIDCTTCPGDCDPVEGCVALNDAGFDAGRDAGRDAGSDAGFDAGVMRDAGFDAGVVRDAGFDAGVARDAGFDAGVVRDAGTPDSGAPGDGGPCVVQPVDPIRTGHAVISGDRVVYQPEDGGVLMWRGSGGTFTERYPIAATSAGGALLAPRFIRAPGGALVTAWRTELTGGELAYAECAGGCPLSPQWQVVNLSSLLPNGPWGSAVGLAVWGDLRAMVGKNGAPPMGGVWYLECTGNCAALASWSSAVTGPTYPDAYGADLEITDAGALVPWRTVVIGGDSLTNPSAMLVRHCTGMCLTPSAWQPGNLPPGVFPDLVVDRAGLPRVFYLTRSPGGALAVSRCTAHPCVGAMPTWQTTTLLAAAESVSAGTMPDGRVWFTAGTAGSVVFGVETPTGYDVTPVTTCSGAPLLGSRPATDPSVSPQRWVVSRDGGLWLE